jgi:hypothetical protein
MDISRKSEKLRSNALTEFSASVAASQPVLLDVREPIEPGVTCGLFADAPGDLSANQAIPAAESVLFR